MLLFFHYFWAIFFWEQPFSQLISYTCHLYLSFAHRLYFLNLNSKYADIHSIAPRNSHGTVFAALSSAESERSCHDFAFTYVFGIGIDIQSTSLWSLQVTPNGLADKAGIRLGDIILEINEEDASQLTLSQAHEKINSTPKKIHFLLRK